MQKETVQHLKLLALPQSLAIPDQITVRLLKSLQEQPLSQ